MNTKEDYEGIAQELIDNAKARVVIMFLFQPWPAEILKALARKGWTEHFIVFSSDSWGQSVEQFAGHADAAHGAFGFLGYTETVSEFYNYFKSLSFENEARTVWFRKYWEATNNCSLGGSALKRQCEVNGTLADGSAVSVVDTTFSIMDPVFTFVQALHLIRETNCANATSSDLRKCISGTLLRDVLKKGTFYGLSGTIKFDKNGDVMGKYRIRNLVRNSTGKYEILDLGFWDGLTQNLKLSYGNIQWPGSVADVPESVCSEDCPPRHYKVQLEKRCCWECRPCRVNEYILPDGSNCLPCPLYHWPDDEDHNVCVEVPPAYLQWSSAFSVLLASLASAGVVANIGVGGFFVRHRTNKLIKASSKELSAMMLVGILISYAVVFNMIAKPTHVTCYVTYFTFNLSFTFIYAPLLTRTNRVYRIFNASKYSAKPPKFISSRIQIVVSWLLISLQVRRFLFFLCQLSISFTHKHKVVKHFKKCKRNLNILMENRLSDKRNTIEMLINKNSTLLKHFLSENMVKILIYMQTVIILIKIARYSVFAKIIT